MKLSKIINKANIAPNVRDCIAQIKDKENLVEIVSSSTEDIPTFLVIHRIREATKPYTFKIIIKSDIQIYSVSHDLIMTDCDFYGTVKVTTLHKKIKFDRSIFYGDSTFQGCKFHDEVSFFYTTFHKKTHFVNCDFSSGITLSSSHSKELCTFLSCKFEFFLDAQGALFEKGLFLSKLRFMNNPSISFFNCVVFEQLDFQMADLPNRTEFHDMELRIPPMNSFSDKNSNWISKTKKLLTYTWDTLFNRSKISFEIDWKGSNPNSRKETFRIIKNCLLASNNKVEALKYHVLEMKSYEASLNVSAGSKYADKLLLYMNDLSNNHGADWAQGVKFTMVCTFIFYLSYLIPLWSNNDIEFKFTYSNFLDWVYYYIQLLNVTNWKFRPFNIDGHESWQYILLFVSRIFIGFGYFQTIQAFRKYGKL